MTIAAETARTYFATDRGTFASDAEIDRFLRDYPDFAETDKAAWWTFSDGSEVRIDPANFVEVVT